MQIYYIVIILLFVTYSLTLPKIFERNGVDGWKGYIPFYNHFELLKMLGLSKWWVLLIFFPGVFLLLGRTDFLNILSVTLFPAIGTVMLACLNVSLFRRYGYVSLKDTFLGIFVPFYHLYLIGFKRDDAMEAPTDWSDPKQVKERTPGDHLVLLLVVPVLGHALAYILKPKGAVGSELKGGKRVRKTNIKEWGDSLLFAIIAASVIRTYVFEPYQIPSPSMEHTLNVGDMLFVNKVKNGPRIPQTPFSYPLVHNNFAPIGIKMKSYLEIQKLPYMRMWGYGDLERGDVFVFNFPHGDTAILDFDGPSPLVGHDYYQILESGVAQSFNPAGGESYEQHRKRMLPVVRQQLIDQYGIQYRPVDRRENYIKRNQVLPGDVLEVRDKVVFINGEKSDGYQYMLWEYAITNKRISRMGANGPESYSAFTPDGLDILKEKFDVSPGMIGYEPVEDSSGVAYCPTLPISMEDLPKLEQMFGKENIELVVIPDQPAGPSSYAGTFPRHPKFTWSKDNFGPLTIPAKGWTIELNEDNEILYGRCMRVYEGHNLEVKDGKYFLDGVEATQYTFEMDYYWAMGDNRDQSADSRSWGFVPEDHIVGTASFIWFARDPEKSFFNGIEWDRVFRSIE